MDNFIERIAHYADIDTRRAMGFPPRKLPTSDLNIRVGKTWWYVGRPYNEVSFDNVCIGSTEDGRIWWCFGMRKYEHTRPSPSVNVPNQILDGIEP
jgi:hypothetical protein